MADPRVSGATPISLQATQNLQQALEAEEIEWVESDEDFDQWCDLNAFNPIAMMRRFRPIEEYIEMRHEEPLKKEGAEKEQKIFKIEQLEEAASRYQRQNFELQAKTLLILRSRISAQDTAEDILHKVLEVYPEPALADEAIDFLIETSDARIAQIARLAKEQLNARFTVEIKAGRNIGAQARAFSQEGLGSPNSLRDMYRDIVLTPREPLKLFDELSDRFSYDKLRTVIHFLLHSLGSDLRSKGPSISRAELIRLIDETRSLQGIMGIYRFFRSRMGLIERQFASYQIAYPSHLQFDALAKQFVKFLAERFMSPDKIFQAARYLGISEEVLAQIIIFTQMRDALRQISPRYYRNPKQRDELLQSFLTALEELEDQLESEVEIEAKKKKKKKK
jgi:type III secretion protein W